MGFASRTTITSVCCYTYKEKSERREFLYYKYWQVDDLIAVYSKRIYEIYKFFILK